MSLSSIMMNKIHHNKNIGMKNENAKKNAEEIEKIVNKDLGKIIKKLQKG